ERLVWVICSETRRRCVSALRYQSDFQSQRCELSKSRNTTSSVLASASFTLAWTGEGFDSAVCFASSKTVFSVPFGFSVSKFFCSSWLLQTHTLRGASQ